MKNNIFILILIALFLGGCESNLEERPKSLMNGSFYNTKEEIEAGIYAIYESMNNTNCLGGVFFAQMEAPSDYGYGRGSFTQQSEYQGLSVTSFGNLIWQYLYAGIRNANIIIKSVPSATQVNDNQKAAFIGEAKFLRAYIYFILVRTWGGIPLRTEDNMTVINLPRASEDDLYKLITEDLTFAASNLPEVAAIPGRPTLWSAKTLLADTYFYRRQYQEAKSLAEEVINAKKFSLVPVSAPDDFMKLFGPSVGTTTEEIFHLKFFAQVIKGNYFVMYFHHPAAKYHGAGGFYALYTDEVDNKFIANWDKSDFRYQFDLYKWDIGLGPNTLLYRKFQDPAAPNQSAATNDNPVYRYADILLMYAEAANRVANGPTDLAVECLNQVHRRAYGYPPTQASPVDFKKSDYNTDSFNELVIQERGYETFSEAKRWFDLKRLGAKERIMQAKGIALAEKHLLWPIPITETNYNKAIDPAKDQNPGY